MKILHTIMVAEQYRNNGVFYYNGNYIPYGFYGKNSNNFYFSKHLKAHDNNIKNKLSVYREFKKYIEERDGYLQPFIVTLENGNEKLKVDNGILIDLDRKIRIRLTDAVERLF